jgi:hypothetical protein
MKKKEEEQIIINKVGGIGNYYGGLSIKKEGKKFYWGIEDHSGMEWERINESLYGELEKYRKLYSKEKE